MIKEDLTQRQEKILYSIIDSFVETAEPIGSRTLNKKYDFGVSPATIRNEMSDLEDLKLITKAHTSSGRIPTDLAYRRYVDEIMNKVNAKLDSNDNKSLQIIDYNKFINADKIILEAARISSSLTNYTCITMLKKSLDIQIKHIELLPLNEKNLVMVIVYNSGDVGNHIIRTKFLLKDEEIKKINFHLNIILKSKGVHQLKDLETEINEKMSIYPGVAESLKGILSAEVDSFRELEFHTEGLTNIFDYPEYFDINRIREFIEFTENKKNILNLFLEELDDYLYVKIGDENKISILKDNTIIVSTYLLNQRVKGKIALIAPKRMDYPKVIEAVMTISWKINHMINNRN